MKPKDFLIALYTALNAGDEGAINFYNALTHGTLQLKNENPKQYFKNLLILLDKYVDLEEITTDENNKKITIPDNWDWNTIEKLLAKEENTNSEIQ